MSGRPEGQTSALVPHENAKVIVRRFGVAGERFLSELPERLADIAGRWQLTLTGPLPIGIGGFLVGARLQDGSGVVLKLSPTGDGQDITNELEAWALKRWDGEGAVRLLLSDPPAGALVIERCVPGESIDTLPDDEMVKAGCALARRLQRIPAAGDERILPNAVTGASERATTLAHWMQRMGHPLSPRAERVVAQVHEDVAGHSDSLVVCHGDMNPGNLLSAQREPWLAIDPLPVLAPGAYDAASLVWSKRPWLLRQPDPASVLNRRIELAGDAAGVPARSVWEWTLTRATGILIDRFSWGGYDEAPLVSLVELLCHRPPAAA